MKNFYLIYGIDNSKIYNEINKIKDKLGVSEIIKYSLDKDLLDDIILDASLVNMFSQKKLILVSDAFIFTGNKKSLDTTILEKYLDNYNSDTYIIFTCNTEKIDSRKKITKKLMDKGTIIEIKGKDANYVKQYINDYLNEFGYKLESLEYFCNKVGTNIDNVKNELDKLMIFKDSDKFIKNSDIDKLVIPSLDDDIFGLMDAIIGNNVLRSLELLQEFINTGYDEMQLISLLASQFRFMYGVKRLYNKGNSNDKIASTLCANPYRVKITIKNCYYYTEDSLLLYLKKLGELDENIKLGKIDKSIGLQLFLLNKDYINC